MKGVASYGAPVLVPQPASKPRFKRILFATDLGVASEQAQIYAALLTRLLGAQLFILHVEPCPTLAETADHTELKINALKEFFQVSGLPFTLLLRLGPVGETIDRIVKEYTVDLVIMGSHGRRKIPYLVHGSIAETLSRSSCHPVIAVGPRAHSGFVNSPKRILYATDFSEESKLVLPFATALAQECQAQLVMAHIAPHTAQAMRDQSYMKNHLLNMLKRLASQSRYPGCPLTYIINFGNAREKILKIAEEQNADLLVVGLHSSTRFPTHLPERFAYQLLCEARCPVLSILPNECDLKLTSISPAFVMAATTIN